MKLSEIPAATAVQSIVFILERQASFWSAAHGWAPRSAADALQAANLSGLVSLARCLAWWMDSPSDPREASGALVLAYANLGCLVEATMQFHLAVDHADYERDPTAIRQDDGSIDIGRISAEDLRVRFLHRIWEKQLGRR